MTAILSIATFSSLAGISLELGVLGVLSQHDLRLTYVSPPVFGNIWREGGWWLWWKYWFHIQGWGWVGYWTDNLSEVGVLVIISDPINHQSMILSKGVRHGDMCEKLYSAKTQFNTFLKIFYISMSSPPRPRVIVSKYSHERSSESWSHYNSVDCSLFSTHSSSSSLTVMAYVAQSTKENSPVKYDFLNCKKNLTKITSEWRRFIRCIVMWTVAGAVTLEI